MIIQVMVLDFKALHISAQTFFLMLFFSALLSKSFACSHCVSSLLPQCTFLVTWRASPRLYAALFLLCSAESFQVLSRGSRPCLILELPRELLKVLCLGSTARGSHLIGLGLGIRIGIMLKLSR